MSAVLFGSISTIADTSELQRDAYNRAFAEHGLSWNWNQEDYATTLAGSGGQHRLAEYANTQGEEIDVAAVHATKSRLFQESVATASLAPRPGVVETISEAKAAGLKIGLVTTTLPGNVSALLAALSPQVQASDFDVVVDAEQVGIPKPDRAAYDFAVETLHEHPSDCLAIEDNVGGTQAAAAAGVPVVAFPNENTQSHTFDSAVATVDHLNLTEVQALVSAA